MDALSVCAVFKNEAQYLSDWLGFHFGAGVDHFIPYDDGSDDNPFEVLRPWVEKGIVTVLQSSGRPQRELYNHCLREQRKRTAWLAFLDLDEYLFSPTGKNPKESLDSYDQEVAIFVYWHLFGSGGHLRRPNIPVPLSYSFCLSLRDQFTDTFCNGVEPDKSDYVTGWSLDGKCVVRPEMVERQGVHKPVGLYGGGLINEKRNQAVQRSAEGSPSAELLRINHY